MNADVQRRQALGDDTFEVGLGEAGERGEVAVQERQAVVVVLEVQAAAQARGQLVDEAELAVVIARAHPVEHCTGHLSAERFVGTLVDFQGDFDTAALHFQRDLGIVDGHSPFDDVTWHDAVHRGHDVANDEAGPRCSGPWRNGDDDGRGHGHPGYRGGRSTAASLR
ncbi:unannotated protein [freshwater metagenome]|uniref:Unannotated protein n=1 Tax=freshwater metagenome TaxID=449393 RepID=A0A6J6ABT1_9ZZZZ